MMEKKMQGWRTKDVFCHSWKIETQDHKSLDDAVKGGYGTAWNSLCKLNDFHDLF